jgi:hypothetical protein
MGSLGEFTPRQQVGITDAEWWELRACTAEVERARLALQVAELARMEAERRICIAHDVRVGQDVELVRDGVRGPSA